MFDTTDVERAPVAIAPDGSTVRVLCALPAGNPGEPDGSTARFDLEPGDVAIAVHHRTVHEIWYVVAGRGRIWRRFGDHEEETSLAPGVSLTIPLGTTFQFCCEGSERLVVLGVTIPAWPLAREEAVRAEGPWEPTLAPGDGLAIER
jgi:mannose-6-phosphate isomerase-like protein (cupin superfamily)